MTSDPKPSTHGTSRSYWRRNGALALILCTVTGAAPACTTLWRWVGLAGDDHESDAALVDNTQVSCGDCLLLLRREATRVLDNGNNEISVAIYQQSPGDNATPTPRQLGVAATRPVTLKAVTLGAGLAALNTELPLFPDSNQPWATADNQTFRILLPMLQPGQRLPAGRILTATFEVGGNHPLSFALVRPSAAWDALLPAPPAAATNAPKAAAPPAPATNAEPNAVEAPNAKPTAASAAATDTTP